MATLTLAVIGASTGTALAVQEYAPLDITVSGQVITRADIVSLVKGVLGARPQQIKKDPGAMPSAAPLVYYAGHGTIWLSKTVDQDLGAWARVSPETQPAEDAFVAAAALAAMDAGTAGKPWQDIWRRTAADSDSRIELGKEVAEAFKTASDQSAAFAESISGWMQTTIAVGTLRRDAYTMLKSRGLVAFNPMYEASRSMGDSACLPPTDPNGALWPYQNEPVPPRTGLCATLNGEAKPTPNPHAFVRVGAAFGMGCEESIVTTISFDTSDRVTKVSSEKAPPSCI
jgi:hypothetical protein